MTKRNVQKWILSLVAISAMTVIMQLQGAALKNSFAPKGIVSLEFGNTIPSVEQMISHWDLATVRTNILLDFVYIPAYAFFFFMSLSMLLNKHQGKLKATGVRLTKRVYIAAGCDVIENILMLVSINGNLSAGLIIATSVMAAIKFILLIQMIFYILMSLIVLFIKKCKENP